MVACRSAAVHGQRIVCSERLLRIVLGLACSKLCWVEARIDTHRAPKADVIAAIAVCCDKKLTKVGCTIRAQLTLDLHQPVHFQHSSVI